MVLKLKRRLRLRDKIGQEIKVGSWIAYGHALDRSAALRIGRVIGLKLTREHWGEVKECEQIIVRGIDDSWSHRKPALCLRNGTLQFPNRTVVLKDQDVPANYWKLMEEHDSKEVSE